MALPNLKSSLVQLWRYILLPCCTMPARIASNLIPKSNAVWIYGCHAGIEFEGNSRFFYEYAKKHAPEIKHIVITHSVRTLTQLKKEGVDAYLAYSRKGLYYTLIGGLCFVTNFVKDDLNYLTISNQLKVIELWHGIPIKSIRWAQSSVSTIVRKFVNAYIPKPFIMISTYKQPIAHTPEIFELSKHQIKPFGYPRNDIFFTKKQFPTVNSLIAEKKYNHIIVYAPTFRKAYDSLDPFPVGWWRKLDVLCKKKKWLFLIKRHMVQGEIIIPESLSNVKDISSEIETIQPLLKKATMLITDYSSVSIDFALTKKPMIFFPYDIDEYRKINELCVDYYKDLPGPFAHSATELLEVLKTVEVDGKQVSYRKKYEQFVEKYHVHQDGLSSKRLFDYVYTDIMKSGLKKAK